MFKIFSFTNEARAEFEEFTGTPESLMKMVINGSLRPTSTQHFFSGVVANLWVSSTGKKEFNIYLNTEAHNFIMQKYRRVHGPPEAPRPGV